MNEGKLTTREAELIRRLLTEHGITQYAIVDTEAEGKTLPGSTYPGEIESMSGYIVTTNTTYLFWLDWDQGSYTLGEREVALDQSGGDKEKIVRIQRQLQQQKQSDILSLNEDV